MDHNNHRRALRIEAALWIVMGTLAFLAKDNPQLEYPQSLYMFAALLASSLATSMLVRIAPSQRALHAMTLLTGYASISNLQAHSGGTTSNLWVLYLLPLFTAAILLEGREIALVAIGACASNAALYAVSPEPWNSAFSFELCLKTGVLACSAAATWALSRAERESKNRASRQREEIGRLEDSLKELTNAREQERGLAAIVAGSAVHDLSTPLMVIRAYSRLHIERGDVDAALEHDLERIDASAAFCQEVVASLLARDAGTPSVRRISTISEAALSLAEHVLSERRVQVMRDYCDEALCVRAPRQDLERVLLNLISNAAKAMPNGGRVTVRVSRAAAGNQPIAAILVEDEGPGISSEILPRLFQPFATTRAGQGGTGLGLYLSREVARRLGGSLDAENRAEGGARFILRLPLVASEASESFAAPTHAAA